MLQIIKGADSLSRYKLDLFNAFHRARRFGNSIGFDEFRNHALSWIGMLDKIDRVTTLAERFDLAGTNTAHRKELIDFAKKHNGRLTLHAILNLKGGNSASYRSKDGCCWHGEQFGLYLSWFTSLDRKDLDPFRQFVDGKPVAAPAAEVAEQLEDLVLKRLSLVKLSVDNHHQAVNRGIPGIAAMYGTVASLHAKIADILREANIDGSFAAIEVTFEKVKPYSDEVRAMDREIVRILKSGDDDAPMRTLQ